MDALWRKEITISQNFQIGHDANSEYAVTLSHCSFSWEGATASAAVPPSLAILRDINWRVEDGALVAVVGSVGSGKSSLLSALVSALQGPSALQGARVVLLEAEVFLR